MPNNYGTAPTTYGDLTARDARILARLKLKSETGQDTTGAIAKLKRSGLDDATISNLLGDVPDAAIENRLRALSNTGAQGAANANFLTAQMAKASSETQLRDAYALDADKLRQQLQAGSSGPVDPNSPAFQATLAQFSQGGADELSRRLMALDQVNLKNLTEAMAQIGSIVEMQRLAREQEALANAVGWGQAAGLVGGMGMGAGVGGAVGGGPGALAGVQGGAQNMALLAQLLAMAGGGGGAQGATMVNKPRTGGTPNVWGSESIDAYGNPISLP